jgi:DivIVA domain-containing protein
MGYNPEQVDALLDLAKRQYESPEQILLRASDLRGLRLDLVSGGYSISQVDAALDNLEDHFIRAEVSAFSERFGEGELANRFEELQKALLPRLRRDKGKRFTRVSWLARGYDKKKVDELCDQLVTHFNGGAKVRVSQVRRAQFTATRSGYSMPQVDSFLDRVIEALQLEITYKLWLSWRFLKLFYHVRCALWFWGRFLPDPVPYSEQ